MTARRSLLGTPRGLVLLGSLTAVTALAVDAYLPALPELSGDLGASSSSVQLTLTALLVGLALGQLVIGPISDAVGRRRPILVGLAVFTTDSVVCALVDDVRLLIALRLVQGASGAAAVVCCRAIVRDLYEGPAAAQAFARLILVMGAAPILAPLLGAQILRFTSWRGIFVLLAVAGGTLLTLAWRLLEETLPPQRRRPGGLRATLSTFTVLGRDRSYVGHALAGGLASAAMFAYISGSPFVLQEVHGLTPQQFSLAFGVNALGLIGISQLGGRWVRTVGARPLLLAGTVTQVCGAALVVLAVATHAGLPVLMPALFLVVTAVGLASPNALALSLADHAAVAGSAAALVGVVQFVLGAGAAPLVGAGGSGTAAPMAAVIAVCAVGALLAALAARRGGNPHRPALEGQPLA